MSIIQITEALKHFKKEGLTLDGKEIRCQFCHNKIINCVNKGRFDKNRIKMHVIGAKHLENKSQIGHSIQGSINAVPSKQQGTANKQQEFNKDLGKIMIESVITFHKLEHPSAKLFLQKWTH